MIHKIHCQEPWFSLIRECKKPVEGRKASPNYNKIKPGDVIEFFCGKDSFQAKVTGINRYDSLKDYLDKETLARALPGVSSLKEGLEIYLQWSTEEQIRKYGFLGIQVSVMKNSGDC